MRKLGKFWPMGLPSPHHPPLQGVVIFLTLSTLCHHLSRWSRVSWDVKPNYLLGGSRDLARGTPRVPWGSWPHWWHDDLRLNTLIPAHESLPLLSFALSELVPEEALPSFPVGCVCLATVGAGLGVGVPALADLALTENKPFPFIYFKIRWQSDHLLCVFEHFFSLTSSP